MNNIKGAVFDIDGTILDSMNIWYKVAEDFFADLGHYFTEELATKTKEMPLEESIPYLIDLWSLDITTEYAIQTMKNMMVEAYKNTIEPKPYVCDYIKKLHDEGVKIAVATSGYKELCTETFKRIGIYEYIDEYAFTTEVGCDKSNPDIYLLAAKRIGINPRDCMVYEDIVKGIGGAKKGGFKACAIYDDTNVEDTEELKSLADIYITSWKELL